MNVFKIGRIMYRLLLICLVLTVNVFSNESNQIRYISIEDLIGYQTTQIKNTDSEDYENLSEKLCSRGESYLFAEKYSEALEDFQDAYDLALLSNSNMDKNCRELTFRALFGQLLSYANLDLIEPLYPIVEILESIIESCKCEVDLGSTTNSQDSKLFVTKPAYNLIHLPYSKAPDKIIEGPDRISAEECVNRVKSTAEAAKFLIARARPEIQAICHYIINSLADAAERCCWAGGLWKGCLQKLVNKWQEWKIFGIPADPTFD